MKKDLTDITILLDRSSSMNSIADATIKGLNEFLAEQKLVPGEARLTVIQFSTGEDKVDFLASPLSLVTEYDRTTYVPCGMTALYDALKNAIDNTGRRLAAMKEEDRPDQVMFVVITDGQENSSTLKNPKVLQEMVTHQKEKYSWNFIFLGANMDAIASAGQIGIQGINFLATPSGMQDSFHYASSYVGGTRMRDAQLCSTLGSAKGVSDLNARKGIADFKSAIAKPKKSKASKTKDKQ